METAALLSHESILRLHRAVISARLASNRRGLLAGLPSAFVTSLPQVENNAEQILTDLDTLNAAVMLAHGTVPLAVWLQNAVALAEFRMEAAVFERALDQVRAATRDMGEALPQSTPSGAVSLRRGAQRSALKYFIYLSDAKVEMMLAQIPFSLKQQLAADLGIEVSALTARSKAGHESIDVRISRLRAVAKYIHEHESVSNVDADDPGDYIYDKIDIHWECIRDVTDRNLLYFAGHTDHALLGMVGSVRHLFGASDPLFTDNVPDHVAASGSAPIGFAEASLLKAAEDEIDADRSRHKDLVWQVELISGAWFGRWRTRYEASPNISHGARPTQRLEFLAKVLMHRRALLRNEPSCDHKVLRKVQNVILATPLYVSG